MLSGLSCPFCPQWRARLEALKVKNEWLKAKLYGPYGDPKEYPRCSYCSKRMHPVLLRFPEIKFWCPCPRSMEAFRAVRGSDVEAVGGGAIDGRSATAGAIPGKAATAPVLPEEE